MINKDLTANEVAERFDVEKRIALGWIERGVFPNARKVKSQFGIYFWAVPEKDLENFQPQRRPGRPASKNPSKAALAKRAQREREQVKSK